MAKSRKKAKIEELEIYEEKEQNSVVDGVCVKPPNPEEGSDKVRNPKDTIASRLRQRRGPAQITIQKKIAKQRREVKGRFNESELSSSRASEESEERTTNKKPAIDSALSTPPSVGLNLPKEPAVRSTTVLTLHKAGSTRGKSKDPNYGKNVDAVVKKVVAEEMKSAEEKNEEAFVELDSDYSPARKQTDVLAAKTPVLLQRSETKNQNPPFAKSNAECFGEQASSTQHKVANPVEDVKEDKILDVESRVSFSSLARKNSSQQHNAPFPKTPTNASAQRRKTRSSTKKQCLDPVLKNETAGPCLQIGEGDYLCDVLKFWSHLASAYCEDDTIQKLFNWRWDQEGVTELSYGKTSIYTAFCEYSDAKFKEERKSEASKFIDLKKKTWISESELNDDSRFEVDKEFEKEVGANDCPSNAQFWKTTEIVFRDVRVSGGTSNVVKIPPLGAMIKTLRRFANKCYFATQTVQYTLQQVPQVYQSFEHRQMHLMISPDFFPVEPEDNSILVFYNLTSEGSFRSQKAQRLLIGELERLHPMFQKPSWRHMIFLVAGLSK